MGVVAIALLTAADILLVKLAFDHVDRPRTEVAAVDSPGRAPSTPESVDAEPSSESTPEQATLPDGPLLLALAPDGAVLVASTGACPAEDEDADGEEATADAGVIVAPGPARAPRDVQVAEGLTAVLALRAGARDDFTVIGAAADCEVQAFEGTARTDVWSPEDADQRWFLDQDGTVHAPGGPVDVPCTPAQLSTVGSVRLLCDDGVLRGTADAGESWAVLGRVEKASAVAFDSPYDGVALVERDRCPVAVATTGNGGAGWDVVGCVEGSTGRAVAVRGDDVAAVVDDTLWRSADGGATWDPQG